MDSTIQTADQVHRVKRGRPAKVPLINVETECSPAQSLAWRIWDGQSPDISVIDRVGRIANALKERGFDLDITLPHVDAGRYLEAHK